METQNTIVIAWKARTGMRKTGRMIKRDLNWFPEFEACEEAHAVIWLNAGTASDIASAEKYAATDGKTVRVYPMTERDPLGRARMEIMAEGVSDPCIHCGLPAVGYGRCEACGEADFR